MELKISDEKDTSLSVSEDDPVDLATEDDSQVEPVVPPRPRSTPVIASTDCGNTGKVLAAHGGYKAGMKRPRGNDERTTSEWDCRRMELLEMQIENQKAEHDMKMRTMLQDLEWKRKAYEQDIRANEAKEKYYSSKTFARSPAQNTAPHDQPERASGIFPDMGESTSYTTL